MFQPVLHNNEIAGHELRQNGIRYFFGTRHCSRELLSQLYPSFEFCFLKQVHGKDIVLANPKSAPAADGHASLVLGQALVIQTADCLPILLSGPGCVAAVHAGWRGLVQRIVASAAPFGVFSAAFIGPHIRAESFEVGLDVANQLPASGPGAVLPHPNPEKRYVDLSWIAKNQIQGCFGPSVTIEILEGDTLRSPLYHSFRRGKDRAARQYSFVVLEDA